MHQSSSRYQIRLNAAYIILCVSLLIVIMTTPLGAQVFTFGERHATDQWPECIAVGHFNDDAFTDIAVSHRDTDLVLIYINDGNASFSQTYSLEVSRESGLHSADFDSDGLDDLLMYDIGRIPPYGWGTTVHLNNGDGTFDLAFQDTIGWSWQHMCTGNFDGDSTIDIAVYHGPDSTGIWVYFGTGGGVFAEPVMIQPFPSEMWLGAADVDNDGNVDIVCSGASETFSLINDGSGGFADPLPAGGAMNSMALASLNGDAFPDLVGKGTYACTGVPHYKIGNGDGTFGIETRAWMTAGVLLRSYVMSADFNSDGYGDIAYYAYDMDSVAVGLNDGLQSFNNIEYITEVDTAGGTYLAAGDFDNDGDLDLAIAGRDDTLTIALSLGAQHSNRILVPEDFPNIQDAVDYAWNLDTIIVGPGIYYENIDFGGKNIILLSSDYADEGEKANLSTGLKNSTTTIIDGGGVGRVFTFDDGEDDRSVVAGFTIQNGNTAALGGGVYCYDIAAPTIIHNVIKSNHAASAGGIMIHQGAARLKNNLIVGNSADMWGGGIYVAGALDVIANNTVYGNNAGEGGGGLYYNYGSPTICNNIFWGNSSTTGGQNIEYLSNPPAITYSVVQEGWPGDANLDEDPMFVDPANADFNLQAGSPCIDAGDPSSPLDPDGTTADIGAYYYPNPLDVDDELDDVLPYWFELSQNYPNPFNPVTTIKYSLPARGDVTVVIHNVLGQQVRTLVDRNEPAGSYTVNWDGTTDGGQPVATGVYLYRFQAGDHVETKKMLLLK